MSNNSDKQVNFSSENGISNAKKGKPNGKIGRGGGHGPGPGGPGGGRIVEKPKNFKKTMKQFIGYLKPYYFRIILVFILTTGSTIFAVVGPNILGKATTALFEGLGLKLTGTGGIDFGYVAQILLTLLALYGASALCSFLESFIMAGVTQKITFTFRESIAAKINRLPLKYYDGRTHGEVISRITNDVDTIGQSLGQSLPQTISSAVRIVGYIVMMLTISRIMTLAALIVIPLSLVVVTIIVKMSQKYFKKKQEYLGHVNGQVEEVYGGHRLFKAFNAEGKAIEDFEEYNKSLHGSVWKSQFLSGVMMPLMNFIGNIGYVFVVVLGCFQVIEGRIDVGGIQSFIIYVRNFTQPISQTAQVPNMLQSTAAAAERVFEFLNSEEDVPDPVNAVSVKNISSGVSFKEVKFGYLNDTIVINNFSADIKEGQKIAIVGPTGAGKTTIVKLLMRFYELNSGQITVGGTDIRDFKRNDLRGMVGMVLQDAWLFNGSIMENIRYGKPSATDEEVKAAAKLAHVDHFVKSLPDSYNMELNEEVTNISQGQKQLLTIARAILTNPKILILDEATSSVDTRTEALIQKAMNNLMEGKTSFIIAHRLSTVRNADLILVMNHGDIIEQGTHEELLSQKGFYEKLYNSQFETGMDVINA